MSKYLMVVLIFFVFIGVTHVFAYNLEVGTYSNGASPSDNRAVTTVESFPIHVLIIKCPSDSNQPHIFVVGMTAGVSKSLGDETSAVANAIQSVGTGTIELGTSHAVQEPSSDCYYAAFSDDGKGDFAYGSRDGTGVAADVTTGFLPIFASTGCWDTCVAGEAAKWKGSIGGTNCHSYAAAANPSSENITALVATTFSVGTDDAVNAVGTKYWWFAVKGVTGYNGVGTYTGTTGNPETVSTINTPTFVITKNAGSVHAAGRWAVAGDSSWGLTNVAGSTDIIEEMTVNGFTVGDSTLSGADTVVYHFFASKSPLYASGVPFHLLFQ